MAAQSGLHKRELTLLAVSHTINDINQGAVPALLPFLIAQRGLSYAAATGVVLAATAISAIVQPLLGLYSDRKPMPWLIPLGMILGGLGLALAGLATDYWMVVGCVLISGAGVAAYHPESYRFANYASRQKPTTGMSVFTVGGNIGFALGPLLLTLAVGAFGLRGTLWLAPSVLVMGLIMARALPRFMALRTAPGVATRVAAKSDWRSFTIVTLVIVLRASLYYGLLSFVPSYLISVRGLPIASANSALTVLSISGAIGTLIGGALADRFGRKRVLVVLLGLIAPMLVAFMFAPNALAIVLIGLVGFVSLATFTVAVVMGQEYASAHLGVASGITTGLAIGVGGASTPLFGVLADNFGVTSVIGTLTVLPILAMLLALTLPGARRVAAPVREAAEEQPLETAPQTAA